MTTENCKRNTLSLPLCHEINTFQIKPHGLTAGKEPHTAKSVTYLVDRVGKVPIAKKSIKNNHNLLFYGP